MSNASRIRDRNRAKGGARSGRGGTGGGGEGGDGGGLFGWASGRNGGRGGGQGGRRGSDDYWTLSTRPLHGLVFLLPLIVLFELGSIFYLWDVGRGMKTTVRAENLLTMFFESFGVAAAVIVPGLTVIVLLLVWHIVSKDRWRVRPMVVAGMGMESALWVLPLLVLANIVTVAASRGGLVSMGALELAALGGPGGAGGGGGIMDQPWQARATISVGAGIYEELVFRLIGIAAVHFVVRDLLKFKEVWAQLCAIGVTAIAFAVYHDVATGVGIVRWFEIAGDRGLMQAWGMINWPSMLFYLVAGVYFAVIYLTRGFGVVVGTHALYDIAVLVFLPAR